MEKEKLKPNAQRIVKVFCVKCRGRILSTIRIVSFENDIVKFTRHCLSCLQGYNDLKLNPPEPTVEEMPYTEFETFIKNAET